MGQQDNTNIIQFLRSLSEKNYSEANKYLQASLESKLKDRIKKANNKLEF